ncbi:MAG: hypothetical protein H0T51_24530, partial [Pirellulales bacterium]|nr:hypothetical protein [Pirellulales bacterium]
MMLRLTMQHVASLALISATSAAAAEHAAIAPYLADDVSSVVYLDLAKFNLPAIAAEMERLKLIPDNHLESSKKETIVIQGIYDQLPTLGARRAYLLVRASDIFQGGPVLIVEVAEEGQSQAVADWLKSWVAEAQMLGDVAAYLPKECEAHGKVVVGAASLERIKAIVVSRDDSPRPEALAALTAASDADAGWVAFGDADSRRVVREMFPQLPAPFMEIDGKLLADGLKWIGVTCQLPPEPRLSVTFEAAAPETAATLSQAIEKAVELAKAFLMKEMIDGPPAHQARAKT